MEEEQKESLKGIGYGASAYFLWGLLPLYWKLVGHVPSDEVLAHRFIWSFVFTAAILLMMGKGKTFIKELKEIISRKKQFLGIILASLFISINWFTYIWAVNNDHVIEASLGYYINPLVSVMLGIIVLKETLSRWQVISFILAATGVLIMTLSYGDVPWAALSLAISFGLYGLFKKMVNAGSLTGLAIETMILTPVALFYVVMLHQAGQSSFLLDGTATVPLLIGAGVATAVPLLLFASAARRVTLTMVGFLQYLAPTLTLILGVFLYNEPFTSVEMAAFSFIWTALIIFSFAKTRLFRKMENRLFPKQAFAKSKNV
ncbi:EamA family transporter RarD [Bacillus marinisedimentorum]|uniref:EamA family transporter RarD n=1 Tax=Bacillus marinisedimentorum TaxID=1821260 RepID=UPI000871BDFE|nr:EamA family transporter RarD [Bacillus marinisedimentorum]